MTYEAQRRATQRALAEMAPTIDEIRRKRTEEALQNAKQLAGTGDDVPARCSHCGARRTRR